MYKVSNTAASMSKTPHRPNGKISTQEQFKRRRVDNALESRTIVVQPAIPGADVLHQIQALALNEIRAGTIITKSGAGTYIVKGMIKIMDKIKARRPTHDESIARKAKHIEGLVVYNMASQEQLLREKEEFDILMMTQPYIQGADMGLLMIQDLIDGRADAETIGFAIHWVKKWVDDNSSLHDQTDLDTIYGFTKLLSGEETAKAKAEPDVVEEVAEEEEGVYALPETP